jgi:hypothetical protein
MSSPHPLNQAVIAQALHDLRNGQLAAARQWIRGKGAGCAQASALVSVLINATVCGVQSR